VRIIKKFISSIVVAITLLILGTSSVIAADISIGNDTTVRSFLDTYTNFTIVDTNHPANISGYLTTFSFYASNTNSFRFVVVDKDDVVKWVSNPINPSVVGPQIFTPSAGVYVESGWNIGLYFASTGTIPFALDGEPAKWTPNNSGVPVEGQHLSIQPPVPGWTDRIYSFVASGTNTCATINSGTITDSKGNPISSGFDKYGYNYQAHLFNGFANNYSRPDTVATSGDKLVMKWSDSWLANVDCNHDGKLDRGLVDGVVNGISMGWETNHYNGTFDDGEGEQKYTEFYKIVWVGPGGPLWGQYEIIQDVYNDTAGGHYMNKVGSPGFGLNDQWTIPLP
jgi:hypothetical protein